MLRISGAAAAIEHFRRVRGTPLTLPDRVRKRTVDTFGEALSAEEVATRIVAAVRERGDGAVRKFSALFDGKALGPLEVPAAELARARADIPGETLAALELAAARITAFQQAAMPPSWRDASAGYGEIVTPLARVGVYVPGGTAPLASTVLMTAIPARVAGVAEIVMCSPAPGDTMPAAALLAAAHVAGVDRVFKIGGAQAIAALAYGTETIPSVDLVCGPGNVFVTAAKKLVFGDVGIDGLYGPTETMIIADSTADPDLCAADLLAQAEHDPMASPILMATSAQIADEIEEALYSRLESLPRRAIAGAAIEQAGVAVVVGDVAEAIEVANVFAPEHLSLMVRDAGSYGGLVRSAGGLFLGERSAEVIGDYVAGPSHVMPTGGTARFASALSVRHFLRVTPILELDEPAFLGVAPAAAALARAEGLMGHAEAAEARLRKITGE